MTGAGGRPAGRFAENHATTRWLVSNMGAAVEERVVGLCPVLQMACVDRSEFRAHRPHVVPFLVQVTIRFRRRADEIAPQSERQTGLISPILELTAFPPTVPFWAIASFGSNWGNSANAASKKLAITT